MSNNRALMGMLNTVDKNQQAKENLATLDNLSTFVDNKRKQEQENQAKLAAFQEQISKEANELLGYDKIAINNLARKSFDVVRNKIKSYGGNLERFYSEGGVTLLSDYKNSIVNSSQMAQFQENKKNMEILLEMEKKGMGHLINPVDKANMDNYRKNKGGKVTYTGQLIDVEMPPSDQFDINTDAGIEYIINFNNNRLKLMNNYMKSYPHLGEPNEQDLKMYAKQLYRVKGTGTYNSEYQYKVGRDQVNDAFRERQQDEVERQGKHNRTQDNLRFELDYMLAQHQMEASKASSRGGKEEDYSDQSYISNASEALASLGNRGIDIGEVDDDFWEKAIAENLDLENIGLDDWNLKGTGLKNNNVGHNFGARTNLGSDYSLRSAKSLKGIDLNAITKAANIPLNENGEYKISNKDLANSKFYAYDGAPVEKMSVAFGSNYLKPAGVVVGLTYRDSNGRELILTDKHDVLSGKPNKDFRAKMDGVVGKSNLVPKTFIAFKDGRQIFYKEVDLNNAKVRSSYINQDSSDNLSRAISTRDRVRRKRNIENNEIEKTKNASKNFMSLMISDQKAVASIARQSSYVGDPSKMGSDRASLVTSFYANMAESLGRKDYNNLIDSNIFQEEIDRVSSIPLTWKGESTTIDKMLKSGVSDDVILNTLVNVDTKNSEFWKDVRKNIKLFKNN